MALCQALFSCQSVPERGCPPAIEKMCQKRREELSGGFPKLLLVKSAAAVYNMLPKHVMAQRVSRNINRKGERLWNE